MNRKGGSFKKQSDGNLTRLAGTKNHKEGNRPRDKDGKPLGVVEQPKTSKEGKA